MKEPERIVAAGGRGAALLASARGDRMSAASRRRALALAAATATATATVSAPAAAFSALRGAVWKWAAIGIAGTLGLVAARGVLFAPEPSGRSVTPTLVAPAPPAPLAPAPPAPVAPPPPLVSPPLVSPPLVVAAKPAPPPARVAHSAPPPPPAATGERPSPKTGATLADEIAAIDAAKRALGAGDAAGALALLDGYDRSFPRGSLAPEATAIRIEALARAGRRAEARALLATFRARHPDSPLLERLAAIAD